MLIEPAREERSFLRFVPTVWVRGDAWVAGICGAFFWGFVFVIIAHWNGPGNGRGADGSAAASSATSAVDGLTMLAVVVSLMTLYAGAVVPRVFVAEGRHSYWLDSMKRFRVNRMAVAGLVLLVVFNRSVDW